MTATNRELLTMIEDKKLDADAICKKVKFNIDTLRRRYSVLVMSERRFIDLPGLFEPDNQVELKKRGIVLSAKTLESLESDFKIGQKFEVSIDKKKITLTFN